MKKYNLKRFLASLLAVLMLASVTGVSPAVFADWGDSARAGIAAQAAIWGKKNSSLKLNSSIQPIQIYYNDDGSIDFTKLKTDIFNAAVDVNGSIPEGITVNDVKIEHKAKADLGDLKLWYKIDHDKHPIAPGNEEIKITYNGNDDYKSDDETCTITFLGREESVISFKEKPTVKIQYNDDLSIKLPELKAAIWENVVDSTTPADLSTANVSIKYYANAVTGSTEHIGHDWVKLDGDNVGALTYPAISEGTWKLRFEFAGNADYKGFSEEVEVTFTGRDPAFELIEGVTEIDAKFADAKNLDTEAIANEIRNVLVKKVANDESINLSDVKVEYWTSLFGGGYKVLDKNASLDADDIGDKLRLRLSWGDGKGNAQYKPFEETVEVKLVDNRIPSVVALVDVANITYNMDASKMIEEIIKNAIDSANSTLPADYKASDFTVRYDDDGTWAPIEGEYKTILGQTVTIHSHLNAGDGQQILVTYNGSAEYKPSDTAEGTLNVAKADVKVNVKKLITMHAGDADLPEGSITLDPDDPEIDVYTIFAGVTSKIGGKVTTSVYLDLPDRFTNNEALTHVLDPLVEKIIGKSFTEILQEGITVGELRQLAKAATSAAETLKPVLNAVGIDIDSFLKVMELINNLPSIADDMVIAIGTPNHAGVYQAFAVTNSINYNTAFGTGTVLVLKNFTGVEIVKSDKLDDGKLTAKEAQDILDGNDQLCTLQKDSKDLNKAAQEALHYRFTGINGGKLYSSHDMPVDPGKYIVTVSVRGGDYYALPTTFTFTIVADPTPEVTPET